MSKRLSAIILLIIVMIVWGSSFAVTKTSLAEIPPILFALLRFVIASALLVGLAAMRGGLAKLPRPAPVGTIALMGLTGVCVYYLAFNISLLYTSASQGALIQSFIPVVTALLAAFFLKESLSAKRMLGIGVSIAGIILIMALAGKGAPNALLGNLLMFGAVVVWSVYTILAKRLAHVDQLVVTAGGTIIGTALLVPAALIEFLLNGAAFPAISGGGWLSIFYLGAISSAGGLLLYNRSLEYLDASQTANFLNLMPVVAAATAVLFLGENLTHWQIAGGALVLLGVWISLDQRRAPATAVLDDSLEATIG